ncbi:AraC family transcriptional regulator [Paenibacillus sp. LHD-117]|uniref:AraC family transcriptional regulator n=1 Tax=Paenibacillus sp. LHD-117 TaxID=3071412 RepID=UPI0027E19275|nr:AraC family transcriptional regulator [Paenibacillus sp. LHD-117]MDQ6418402.1 AraC family transcriptional regulator [Paenibacillus sp. LHD-117]
MTIPILREATLIDPQVQSNFHIEYTVKHTYPLHGHDYYEIFIVTAGKCTHSINGEAQYLEKGAMAFIRPDDKHCYDFYDGEDCRFINVNFYREVVESAFDYVGHSAFAQSLKSPKLSPYVMLSIEDMEVMIGKSAQIQLYTTTDKQKARMMARSFLTDALAHFFLRYRNENKKPMPQWLDLLLAQLQKKENFTAGLDRMNALADRSGGHLNRVFKQYLRMTPTAYINRLRLAYAKNLLLTTSMSIMDIAYEAGYENLSHFYHLFKQHYGIAPGKIRSR